MRLWPGDGYDLALSCFNLKHTIDVDLAQAPVEGGGYGQDELRKGSAAALAKNCQTG
jgi:hypothetical protein